MKDYRSYSYRRKKDGGAVVYDTTNGGAVEFILCVLIGAIVSVVLLYMVLTLLKPIRTALNEIETAQTVENDELQKILTN